MLSPPEEVVVVTAPGAGPVHVLAVVGDSLGAAGKIIIVQTDRVLQ